MKLKSKGAFFARNKENDILFIIYVSTNDIIKKHPEAKLSYIDKKTKTYKQKSHSPNKLWFVMFDKNGRDYLSPEDVSSSKLEKLIKKNTVESYNYDDYSNPDDLYIKMKGSKLGLDKFYTKKWFSKNYKFIKNQLQAL
jgi:hypothetical protein